VNIKKFLSGPFIWIIAAVIVLIIGSSMVNGSSVKQVDTSVGMGLIKDGKAVSVKILEADQRVDITLAAEDPTLGKQVQFFYVSARGEEVVKVVNSANLGKGFNDEAPNTPWFVALLGSLLPFIIIGLIFWFILSSASCSLASLAPS